MKRFNISLRNKTYSRIESIVAKCNDGFDDGSVRIQDVIEWMLSQGSHDVQKIRQRCISLNKVLKNSPTQSKTDLKELMKKISIVEALMDEDEEEK